VLLVAGAREVSRFALPPRADCLALPALHKTADGRYESRALGVSLGELIELRGRGIAAALAAFRPDVLVVDKEPRGALGELVPALKLLRGRTRCVLGLRDVLDDPATVRREWAAAGNDAAVREFYDAVWVYGDPGVYDVVRECRLAPALAGKVAYTGYLDPRDRAPAEDGPDPPAGPFALCTVGGGQDGARVAEAFAAALRPAGLAGVVVGGPYLPDDARQRLHRRAEADPTLRVLDFDPEPCRLLARAERVVAMGGYNTVCEVLAFGKPALIVPRVAPRREQFIRASRMRELGLLDVLHPDEVGPEPVARWLAAPPAVGGRRPIDLNGTGRLPRLVRALLDGLPPVSPCCAEVRHAAG
jgi:predicted glycosyltransferase